ncbi:ac75 [Erannis ankeraria nucleopolyhedrovirus]|uniref:ac75 n=1 Tax=Erannis ankeraria nucleopolyhedrovirus TaxID=2913600 RepID=UPI001179A213|nr:ac75 [Erannis ankeraria nucleopolyhedrovirus]UJZ89027.1 ac75 [Erannis ankeraria nucleopolyhedrovirus]
MDLLKNFVNHVIEKCPEVCKAAYVSTQLKKCIMDINMDEKFSVKFYKVLDLFIKRKISNEDICRLINTVDGFQLTDEQIEMFCNDVYNDEDIIYVLDKLVDRRHLDDTHYRYIADFLIREMEYIN